MVSTPQLESSSFMYEVAVDWGSCPQATGGAPPPRSRWTDRTGSTSSDPEAQGAVSVAGRPGTGRRQLAVVTLFVFWRGALAAA